VNLQKSGFHTSLLPVILPFLSGDIMLWWPGFLTFQRIWHSLSSR